MGMTGNQIKVSNRNLCLCAPAYSNGVLLRFYTCGSCPNSGGDLWSIGGTGSSGAIRSAWDSSSCGDVKNGQEVGVWLKETRRRRRATLWCERRAYTQVAQ